MAFCRKVIVSRRKYHSSKGAPAGQGAPIKSGSSPPATTLFKCPCEGENPDCVHCNGSGHTSRPVELRSNRTLSLDHPSTEPFRTKRERLFDVQISNELPYLREAYLRQKDRSQVVFLTYLRRLATALSKPGSPSLLYWLPELWDDGDLSSLARRLGDGRKSAEDVRILARAARACLVVVKAARTKKRATGAGQQQQTRGAVDERSQLLRCPHCGTVIYNQDQHNQLFHPGLGVRPKPVKPPKRAVQAPQISPLAVTPVPAARQPATAKPQKSAHTTPRRSNPASPPVKDVGRARADTGPVERDMDARRTWGGRFRDTNGTFGSHPLHDSMDDESNPG